MQFDGTAQIIFAALFGVAANVRAAAALIAALKQTPPPAFHRLMISAKNKMRTKESDDG